MATSGWLLAGWRLNSELQLTRFNHGGRCVRLGVGSTSFSYRFCDRACRGVSNNDLGIVSLRSQLAS